MNIASAHLHDPRWPVHPETSDRRLSVVCDRSDTVWLAVRREIEGSGRIVVYRTEQVGRALHLETKLPDVGAPDRPALAVSGEGPPQVAWNAWQPTGWRIVVAALNKADEQTEPVCESVRDNAPLCLAPALAAGKAGDWLAWPEAIDDCLRIRLAARPVNGDWIIQTVSDGDGHAFRPALAVGDTHLFLAWDQYRAGCYEVIWQMRKLDGEVAAQGRIRRRGSHALSPSVAVDTVGGFYLAYQRRTDVVDSRYDIFDHQVSAHALRIDPNGKPHWFLGPNDWADVIVDLSPGLLASETDAYRSYDGLRRHPQVTVTGDNRAWLCVERRIPNGSERDGEIVAVGLAADIGLVRRLGHCGGVCYGVPPRTTASEPRVVFIPSDISAARVASDQGSCRYANDGAAENALPERVALAQKVTATGADYQSTILTATGLEPQSDVGGDASRHWTPLVISPQSEPDHPDSDCMADYRLYWFDLHAHSSRSPDAEGEPDELLAYGRDVARLDGMAVVDNDYYPHKTLAEAEWRLENDLARLYSESGRFIVFPAYEYTFFDEALTPSINHRTVLFRRPGGPLLRCTDPESRSPGELVARLPRADVLLLAHHGTWQADGDDVDGVEICSSWRVCMEELDFVEQRLAAGDRFGFLGSSDSHRAVPGHGGALTGVFARELTHEAIFEALRARRTIATQGRRIDARMTVGDWMIGQSGRISGAVPIRFQVRSPQQLASVALIRDRTVIHRINGSGLGADAILEDSPGAGTHCYRLRIQTEGDPGYNIAPGDRKDYRPFGLEGPFSSNLATAAGPFAWTTPVWVEVSA